MELLAVFVSLCFVSSGLFLRAPVTAVPVRDFLGYSAEGNQGHESRVRYRPLNAAPLYNADELGDEDIVIDDDSIDRYLDKAKGRFGPANVKYVYGHLETSPTYNVMEFGAEASGQDDSQAFGAAWKAACGDDGGRGVPTLNVPGGKTFMLKPISFTGPCKSTSVVVQIDGNLVAPGSLAEWGTSYPISWLLFERITNLIIQGSGSLDGQGSIWWSDSSQRMTQAGDMIMISVDDRPTALRLLDCDNLVLSGLHHLNSPRNHISLNGINGATISDLHIVAPQDSPNTDGIDIASSRNLQIHDLKIETGDDCIAINSNTFDLNITGITCGPGHGISVGSLGKGGESTSVGEIHVRNCTFVGTQNGARIKTFQGGSGTVSSISFEDIILEDTQHPIIIDQFYCDHQSCGSSLTNLEISGVMYNGFQGTSAGRDAITFKCANTGCKGIVMNQINILSADSSTQVNSVCENAHGTYTNIISPQNICLTA